MTVQFDYQQTHGAYGQPSSALLAASGSGMRLLNQYIYLPPKRLLRCAVVSNLPLTVFGTRFLKCLTYNRGLTVSTLPCSAFLDSFFHHSTLAFMTCENASSHFKSNLGSTRPVVPDAGGPAMPRNPSKYSSKSGENVKKGTPSPRFARLSCSHFSISLLDGSSLRPAKTRATATACHSKTRKVNPPVTWAYM